MAREVRAQRRGRFVRVDLEAPRRVVGQRVPVQPERRQQRQQLLRHEALAGARQVEAVAVLRSGADVPRPVRLPQHELVHIQQCAAVPARDARRHVAVAAGHLRGPLLDARRPRAVLPLLVGQPRGPVHRRRRHDHDDARDLARLLYYRFKVRLELEQRHVRALRAYAGVVRAEPHRREQVGLALGRPREERRGQLPRPARVVAAVAPIIHVRAPPVVVRQRRGPALGLEAALREGVAEEDDRGPREDAGEGCGHGCFALLQLRRWRAGIFPGPRRRRRRGVETSAKPTDRRSLSCFCRPGRASGQ